MTGLDDAADELYAGAPGEFIARRDAAVKRARADGDRELAKAIAALRKPTVSAWVVNAMMRDDEALAERMLELGDSLREAEQSLDGAAMRELSQQRRQLVRSWVAQGRRLAVKLGQPVTEAVAQEVDVTLTAALADPAIAEEVTSGRLTAARSYSGFGSAGLASGADGERHLSLVRSPADRRSPAGEGPGGDQRPPAGKRPPTPKRKPAPAGSKPESPAPSEPDDEKAKARRERERVEAEKREAARLEDERRREAERAEEQRLRAEAQATWEAARDAADEATAAHEAALDRRDDLAEQLSQAEAALKAAERELKSTRAVLKTAKARRDLLGRGSDR